MKKRTIGFPAALLAACLLLSGCGDGGGRPAAGSSGNNVPNVMAQQAETAATPTDTPADTAAPSPTAVPTEFGVAAPSAAPDTQSVDIDLTKMNKTMVYAQVFDLVNRPEDFIGKTIRIKGSYSASYFEETKKYYHYVIIADATACCSQGMEFIWKGDHTYPDDYPPDGQQVEIEGVFGTYDELGVTYPYLTVDAIRQIP